jgi:hypothetical protein
MVDFVIETTDTKLVVHTVKQTRHHQSMLPMNQLMNGSPSPPLWRAAAASDSLSVDHEARQTNHHRKKKRKTTNQVEIKQAPAAPPMLTRRVRVYPTRKQRVVLGR